MGVVIFSGQVKLLIQNLPRAMQYFMATRQLIAHLVELARLLVWRSGMPKEN